MARKSKVPHVLDDQEMAWVDRYLVHFNCSQASRDIGISTRSNTARKHGSLMRSRPWVEAEIQRRVSDDNEKFHGLRHSTIRMLAATINFDQGKLFKRDGSPKSWREMEPEDRLAIHKVAYSEFTDPTTNAVSRKLTVTGKNAMDAARLLAKMLGWEAKEDDDLGADHIREAAETFDSKLADLRRATGPDQPGRTPDVPGVAD